MAKLNIGCLVRAKFESFRNVFIETFESNWFFSNLYNTIFTEDWEGWSLGNFITIFTEPFNQAQWYIDNLFNDIFIENFENWFVLNPYNLQFTEAFENGGW